jgi:hypothetical protein
MAKKRSLIDAARDTVREKKRPGKVHHLPSRLKRAPVAETKTTEQVERPPSRSPSVRRLVLVSISIAVGFIGGVLVSRYFRIT